MTITMQRPSLMEQIGTAANASRLVMDDKGEHELDRIAALGYAGIEMSSPRAYLGARWSVPETDRIRAELAVMLWRAKAARDDVCRRHAEVYLAELMREWPDFAGCEESKVTYTLRPFAARLIWEWIQDKCLGCCGTGLQEPVGKSKGKRGRRKPSGQRVTLYGRGLQRVICAACRGTQRARIDDKARAAVLGLPMEWYLDLKWPRRFAKGRRELMDIAGRVRDPLLSAKSGSTVAP